MSADQAVMLVSSGNGPGECRIAVAHLLARLAEAVEAAGLAVDVAERPAEHGPASAVVVLTGPGAERLAREWEGVVLWRCPSPLRPRHPRKTWFVQLFGLPAPGEAAQIDPAQVTMEAIRAGGPGGQHQNKTASAVRARWTDPAGRLWSVVVRDDRSQHLNRRIALARLSAMVAAERAEAEAARRDAAHALHAQLIRGAPKRIFEGPRFRPARA
ncbi:peptide chain release factor [Rhodobacter viridis]|uniref:Peptide chain release factor n=1 Tax=Rhodobacter viridis TaxID=1054202 RepID=A0A318TZP3_9RHOB|nr:peptide chain release factor-like protein [Rhodobacter viridis]PYF10911.1 peptide chain release factor [Rhodobacter viridis]